METVANGFSGIGLFRLGCLGASVMYAIQFREKRLLDIAGGLRGWLEFRESLRAGNWRMIVFDLSVFVIAGGVISLMISQTWKEAILTGMTWQAIMKGTFQAEA